jgi:hypothetical protein
MYVQRATVSEPNATERECCRGCTNLGPACRECDVGSLSSRVAALGRKSPRFWGVFGGNGVVDVPYRLRKVPAKEAGCAGLLFHLVGPGFPELAWRWPPYANSQPQI